MELDLTQLPSPHELRHKIMIKGKKIDSGKEAAKSPVESPASCSSSESEFLSNTSSTLQWNYRETSQLTKEASFS